MTLRNRRFRLSFSYAVGTALGLFLASAGWSDPPRPLRFGDRLSEFSTADTKLTIQARAALSKEEGLADSKIQVSVRNKIATLTGTLTSAEAGNKASAAVKTVSGIAVVMNECRVDASSDRFAERVADAVKQGGFAPQPEPLRPTALPTSRQVVAKPEFPPLDSPNLPPLPTPMARLEAPRPAAPTLLPELTVTNSVVQPVGRVEWKAARDISSVDLERWMNARRSEDGRFQHVTVDVQDGIVRMRGTVGRMSDAWDLADALNALPGVRTVFVGDVQTR